ncbi:MAG TPA: leucyl aminopeptidase [Ktedonobacteraceae bacterium]|jgi:leucyl aminopeptidase
MDVQITTQAIHDISCDALIVAAARKKVGQEVLLMKTATAVDGLLDGLIHERCTDGEFKGNLGEILTIHPMGQLAATRVIVIGLGDLQKISSQTVRRASASAARHLQNTGAHQILLAIDGPSDRPDTARQVQAQLEGALLGLYTFRIYQRTENNSNSKDISHIKLLANEENKAEFEQAIHKAQILAEATNFARNLINEPPNVLTPNELAHRTSIMAKGVGLECEIWNKAKIAELGMGGLLGVSQGSAEPPQFVILRYRGAPDSGKGMALVGKGITFDTGGISIKPAHNMDTMKGDMGGAAAVIGAIQAIAKLRPPINVTALIPTCENMLSGTAYRPGDILRFMNGKTIEIVNTDAEGRLILADALSYAAREGLSPIIDLATLTGGIVVALGSTMTGLFCNDESLTGEIIAAGRIAGEKYWPMPLDDEYNEQIKSDIADIKQTGGRTASSVTAAKILEHFIGDAKWAHLDIAGTSYLDSKKSYQEKGGTGVGVRTLAELVLRLAHN